MESPPAHALCISCRIALDPSWSFCPECGTDNRSPEDRPPVESHTHDYPTRVHCVFCGQKVPDVDDMGQPVNRTWLAIKGVIGFLLFPRRRSWRWWWDE